MPLPVSDLASNAEENIAHAAKIIGRSVARQRVFDAIYTNKRRIKTVADIRAATGLGEVRVLQEGKRLADNHIVSPTRVNGRRGYEKIDFFHQHKRRILSLAASPEKLRKFPTKRNPAGGSRRAGSISVSVSIPRQKQRARLITVDDIDNFAKVRKVRGTVGYTKMPETQFKGGIARILGEPGRFKDWGGENRDLASTRLSVSGKRRSAALAFKGPGKTGKLTPGKMGKNGDQIQRLAKCPADVFIVQYWAEIDDAVLEQLERFSQLKSYLEGRDIFFGVIDGVDSSRLLQAYPRAFTK